MQLLIIRHGDPDYPRDALTEKGTREAELLAARLEKLDIADYYMSPLGRAMDTAKPTLERVGKQATVCDWLQEFPIRFPDPYTGRLHVMWDYLPALRAQHPLWSNKEQWMDDPIFTAHRVRPMVEHVWNELDLLLASYGYIREGEYYRVENDAPCLKKVALFCHLGIGTVLLSHLTNLPTEQLLHTVFMAPSSVTFAVTEEQEKGLAQFRCIGIGDTSHLYVGDEPVSRSGFFAEAR